MPDDVRGDLGELDQLAQLTFARGCARRVAPVVEVWGSADAKAFMMDVMSSDSASLGSKDWPTIRTLVGASVDDSNRRAYYVGLALSVASDAGRIAGGGGEAWAISASYGSLNLMADLDEIVQDRGPTPEKPSEMKSGRLEFAEGAAQRFWLDMLRARDGSSRLAQAVAVDGAVTQALQKVLESPTVHRRLRD